MPNMFTDFIYSKEYINGAIAGDCDTNIANPIIKSTIINGISHSFLFFFRYSKKLTNQLCLSHTDS